MSPGSYLFVSDPLHFRLIEACRSFGAPANKQLQYSIWLVTSAWISVATESASSEQRTRCNWHIFKKIDCRRWMHAWPDKLIYTPRQYALVDALMMSVPGVNVGPFSDFLMMWSEPVHRSSVVSSFSLRRLTDIQWLTFATHDSNVLVAEVIVAVTMKLCVICIGILSDSVLGC